MHTARSDGTGTLQDITQAAARAGLKFVIVSDHGDGTRAPDAPAYLNGVLSIDAVEISTTDGHLVALGLPRSPFPLRGEGRDVLEDVSRLGGFSIAAHPGSPKPDLRWNDWNDAFDGLEWLNADSEWRDERWWTLAKALLVYPFRSPQALALLLDRPSPVLAHWDELVKRRRIVGIVGSDAHARVGVRTVGEPYDNGTGSLHFPSYEKVFREFSISLPEVVLTGDPDSDAELVLGAIREGHVYSTIDALAEPPRMRFVATTASGGRAAMGDALGLSGPVTLRAEINAPPDAHIALLRDGVSISSAVGGVLEQTVPAEVVAYRVEIALPGAPGNPPVPWIVSNPIYLGRIDERTPPATPVLPRDAFSLYGGGPVGDWTIEKSPASAAAIDVVQTLAAPQALLRFALSGVATGHPYAAFVLPAGPIDQYAWLSLTARADRPLRLSVQLRASGGTEGRRWQRSVFLDQSPRTIRVRFDDVRPVPGSGSAAPVLSDVQSILFVLDDVNTAIGSNGQVWVSNVQYGR